MPLNAASWTQQDRLIRLSTPLGADKLLAERLHGIENLSDGFRFQITALSEDAHIELKTLIGQPALLELLTSQSRTDLRPFHGHITRIEMQGSNAGLARYRLTLEPWTAFLAYNRDSAIYQDMTLFDILDSLFQSYQGQGKLNPQWRYELADRSVYPKRSLTTQYQESDADFMQRLLAEDGLFYWFEHQGDADSDSLGSHTLIIADHNGVFQPNAQADIDFAQPGTVIKDDRIDRWQVQQTLNPQTVSLQSWDYRTLSSRPVAAGGTNTADYPSHFNDSLGAYQYTGRDHGQRLADRLQQALAAHQQRIIGEGTVRSLAPASTFTLGGHPSAQGSVLIWQVEHRAHNNLSADLQALIEQNLGIPQDSGHPSAQTGQRPLYRNRIHAIPAQLAYRNPRFDAHGQLLHRKPSVHGQQTAIVVGPPGEAVYTDRDHRIKVQFHWQRGHASHSRLQHPRPGHTGAPANDQAGTWVRVLANLAPTAGANWGGVAIPRIGQEVLIDFIEGDIDRPVAIASLYNGKGQADAQHNQITRGAGAAIGGHSAWFPGAQRGHAHPASLSGLKSQAISQSQQGSGAYNQLVFDDSPQESRTSLQHHGQAHQGTAELNLGYLRHQSDNQRLDPAGFGAELKTPHSAAVRAGQGLLVSSDARTYATSHHLDSQEALAQNQQSQPLQHHLATIAQQHHAQLNHPSPEPKPQDLPAIKQMAHSQTVLDSKDSAGARPSPDGQSAGGAGQVTAYSEPHLQLSSPAGIIASTPRDAILSAGHTSSLTASHDLNLAAQGNHHHLIKNGISLFTYGQPLGVQASGAPEKPNTETGIKLHAATGKVSVQSQSDLTKITADKTITVASTQDSITIAAPQHLLMTARSAYLRLEGGNIMLHGPGKIEFKASMKEWAGAGSTPNELPVLPVAKHILNKHFIELNLHDDRLQPIAGAPYKLIFEDGTTLNGKLDGNGFARVEGIPPGAAKIYYGDSPNPYTLQAPNIQQVTDENLSQDLKKLGLDPDTVDLQALIEKAAGRTNL